jgi:hypothetical protein
VCELKSSKAVATLPESFSRKGDQVKVYGINTTVGSRRADLLQFGTCMKIVFGDMDMTTLWLNTSLNGNYFAVLEVGKNNYTKVFSV